MLRPLGRLAARLARDTRGVSLIETVLAAPVMLMLLGGASDLALGFSLNVQTQQAAARAIEYASNTQLAKLTDADVNAQAATAANVPGSQVTVVRWRECDGTVQSSFDGTCQSGQEIARYISVKISNSYTPKFGALVPASTGLRGPISFSGSSSVRLQ